jgi:paraquat-inducible protein A
MTAQQLRWLLVIASLLLLGGFFSPIMTITQLVWINHSFSILSGIWQLWQEGHIILFLLVAGFSVILPIAKIILLFNLLHPKTTQVHHRKKLLHLMHNYGRWAMLDVMVVAMLIVSVKLGAIASIQIHAGLYVFGGAVLLIMLITHQVVNLYKE